MFNFIYEIPFKGYDESMEENTKYLSNFIEFPLFDRPGVWDTCYHTYEDQQIYCGCSKHLQYKLGDYSHFDIKWWDVGMHLEYQRMVLEMAKPPAMTYHTYGVIDTPLPDNPSEDPAFLSIKHQAQLDLYIKKYLQELIMVKAGLQMIYNRHERTPAAVPPLPPRAPGVAVCYAPNGQITQPMALKSHWVFEDQEEMLETLTKAHLTLCEASFTLTIAVLNTSSWQFRYKVLDKMKAQEYEDMDTLCELEGADPIGFWPRTPNSGPTLDWLKYGSTLEEAIQGWKNHTLWEKDHILDQTTAPPSQSGFKQMQIERTEEWLTNYILKDPQTPFSQQKIETIKQSLENLKQLAIQRNVPAFWTKKFGAQGKNSTPLKVRLAEENMDIEERTQVLQEAGYRNVLDITDIWEDPTSNEEEKGWGSILVGGTSGKSYPIESQREDLITSSLGTEGPSSPEGFIPRTGLFLYSPQSPPQLNTPENSRSSSPEIITLEMLNERGTITGQILLNGQVQR